MIAFQDLEKCHFFRLASLKQTDLVGSRAITSPRENLLIRSMTVRNQFGVE